MYQQSQQKNKKKPKMAGFQRYFQGYTEAKVAKKNGKGFKVIRIYTDPWHVHDMDDAKWKRQKAAIGALSAFALVAYVLSALNRGTGNNASMLVVVTGLLSAASLLFQLVWALLYVTRARKMTVYDCDSTSRSIKLWSVITAALLALTAASSLIKGAAVKDSATLISALGYFLSAGALALVYLIERKTEYIEEENDNVIPFDRYSDF